MEHVCGVVACGVLTRGYRNVAVDACVYAEIFWVDGVYVYKYARAHGCKLVEVHHVPQESYTHAYVNHIRTHTYTYDIRAYVCVCVWFVQKGWDLVHPPFFFVRPQLCRGFCVHPLVFALCSSLFSSLSRFLAVCWQSRLSSLTSPRSSSFVSTVPSRGPRFGLCETNEYVVTGYARQAVCVLGVVTMTFPV